MAKAKVRSYKPGKYGKGLIQSEDAPQAMIWRVKGGWNGDPHHVEVSDALQVVRPNVAFHIDKQRRFYFHSEDPGFVHPEHPARLAAHVHRQYSELTWGRISAEDYEHANGLREGHRAPKTLAIQNRPLRPFEHGAHLHVLDWTHSTVRHRFQEAGAVQVKAASKAFAQNSAHLGASMGSPQLPSLEAAIHGELRKLYALGHATVRSELDHQATGNRLTIGLSKAPAPPGLRKATDPKQCCATCHMFDASARVCWGYGNYGSQPDELLEPDDWCRSWAAETAKTLALGDPAPDSGSLAARARLAAQAVAHAIWQAIHRARLQGITDTKALRQIGRQAGAATLAQQASHHAGGAISAGRHAAALTLVQGGGSGGPSSRVIGARYTSVLDANSCGPCREADTGELIPLGDPRWIPTPNPACLGGGRCRCIHVYQLDTEAGTSSPVVPDDFPSEPDQPDRVQRVARTAVSQVGVGGS